MSARRISIIIPARTRRRRSAAPSRRCSRRSTNFVGRRQPLSSKRASTEAEILLVDNASTDATVAVITDLAERRHVRVVECNRFGTAVARNVGAAHARGDILVFIDADTRVPSDALVRIRELVEEESYAAGIFRLAAQQPGLRGVCWWMFWNAVRLLPLPRREGAAGLHVLHT